MKINFNKKNINIISFFVSVIIFLIILLILNLFTKKSSNNFYSYQNQEKNNKQLSSNENIIKDISINEISNWKIEIEKLNLNANIKEGTSKEIIKNNIGHYTNSNILCGIIALKAYNIGEKNNYFANLKELQIDDEINYTVNEVEIIYKVISNKIIENNALEDSQKEYTQIYEYIQSQNNFSKKNILILITYVKDMPNKFRCVIAEKKIN